MTVGESVMRVVCKTSNRAFVGLPLCRNPEYVNLNVQYAIDVVVSAMMLRNLPAFMRPFVARFLIPIRRAYTRAERLMAECITDRLHRVEDGSERPVGAQLQRG
ncbi:hypothetical protein AURDEDRAFT_59797 [Auricularia subglabra TFB-10046 SS5]|nr:hypothetical protein AURDEDRAFT_59797 [Auricularia subglabra TFB-10046 SS5]